MTATDNPNSSPRIQIKPDNAKVKFYTYVEWFLLKVAMWRYDGSIREINNRSYDALKNEIATVITNSKPDPLVCDLARKVYEEDISIYGGVIDKTRMLLGICPLLITLLGLLLPRTTHAWLGILPLMCFLGAILLLFANIGVSTHSSPAIDEELISQSDPDIVRREIACNYYQAYHLNIHRTQYAVDVYKASLRYIIVGSTFLSLLLMASLVWPPEQKTTIVVQPATMPAITFTSPAVSMPNPIINVSPTTAPASIINVLPTTMPVPIVNVTISPDGHVVPAPSTKPTTSMYSP